MRRLEEAIAKDLNHAFETTLGGNSSDGKDSGGHKTHDVLIWFCGLSSPELHIARVEARVAAGGHPIPEEKIRERYPRAQLTSSNSCARDVHQSLRQQRGSARRRHSA